MDTNLKTLEEKYNLELDRAVKEIKKSKAKIVLVQLPDGLKHYGPSISDYLQEKTKALIVIHLGTCFGACDIPQTNTDMIIQFGHSEWK